jgi:hypothetical protein
MQDDSQGQAGAQTLAGVEAMIAAWDRDGDLTYRELAVALVTLVRGIELPTHVVGEGDGPLC